MVDKFGLEVNAGDIVSVRRGGVSYVAVVEQVFAGLNAAAVAVKGKVGTPQHGQAVAVMTIGGHEMTLLASQTEV